MRTRYVLAAAGAAAASLLLAAGLAPSRAGIDAPPFSPTAPGYSTSYIFSLLNEADLLGPKTFTSVDGINAAPLTAGNGADIYTDTKFRDPRLLKVGSAYFLSYTANTSNSPSDPTIGLATSSDLKTWTKVSTPNWSSLFTGSQASIWNGAWFQDPATGNYYLYFATSDWATTVTPYVVQFFPATQTFGTPQAVTLSPTRVQSTIVAVWLSGGTYYALLQSSGSGNNEHNVELLSASSPTGTWSIIGANNFASWGNNIECGAEIAPSAGVTRVYFCAFGGGAISYSQTSASPPTSGWSAPVALTTFTQNSQSWDWVDIVPFSDTQTDQAVHALQGSGGNSAGLVQGGAPQFYLNSASGQYAGYNLYSNGTLYGVIGFQPSGPLDMYVYTANGALLDFGTANTSRHRIGMNGGLYGFGVAGGDEGAATVNETAYYAGGTAGVSCSGSPTSSFASVNGIVTHC
jgi:hypothetical protein